jgi:hypothetical protein
MFSKNKILITKADGIYKTEFIGTSHRFEGRLKVGDQGEKLPGSPAFLAIREDNSCC